MHLITSPVLSRARGFSLAELMISIAIGMLMLAGMVTLFDNNAKTQREVERANVQIENGRFAISTIGADLINAGFYGEFDPTPMTTPTTLPNACTTTLSEIRAALPLHLQGVDNVSTATTPSCLSSLGAKANTDVLVVRRVQTCVAGTDNCAATSTGGALFQASLCANATQLDSTSVDDAYDLETDTTLLTRRQRDCTAAANTGTLAVIRRFVTHIYFVASNSSGTDGIPTLKRLELGGSPLAFTLVPLVEGVENLQLEHGIDFDSNGTPDVFAADPGTAANPASGVACAAPACAAANWRNVVAVKLHVLGRNLEQSLAPPPFVKTYVMGANADGSSNDFTPGSDDKYRRHLFQTTLHLSNPAGRKTP